MQNLTLKQQEDAKKKEHTDIVEHKKQMAKNAKKQQKEALKDAKKEEKAKQKELLKAQQEAEKKKSKINPKKLISSIDRQKLLLESLNNDMTKEDIIKQTKDTLNINLELLQKYTKQEKI